MLPMMLLHKMCTKVSLNTNLRPMQLVSHLVQHTLRNSVVYQKGTVFNVLYLNIE